MEYIIAPVIGLIVLIAIIVIAANVGALKKVAKSSHADNARNEYFKYKILGDKEIAYGWLLYFIIAELRVSESHPEDIYNKLKKKHEKEFIELHKEFPEYPFQ